MTDEITPDLVARMASRIYNEAPQASGAHAPTMPSAMPTSPPVAPPTSFPSPPTSFPSEIGGAPHPSVTTPKVLAAPTTSSSQVVPGMPGYLTEAKAPFQSDSAQ